MNTKKLALFDIDGTILPKGYGIFFIAEKLADENLINPKAPIAMAQVRTDYRAGKMPYETYSHTVQAEFAKGLIGYKKDAVETRSKEIVKHLENTFYTFAKHLLPLLNKTYDVYFITANVDFYAHSFQEYYHSKGYRATIMAIDAEGKYTGKFELSLSQAENKRDIIQDLVASYPKEGSLAMGDADADRFMLAHVEIPVCIDPTDNLLAEAKEKDWHVTDAEHAEEVLKSLITF